MGMMVDGVWNTNEQLPVTGGNFTRPTSELRSWVTPDGEAGPTGDRGYAAERGRYRLYLHQGCPWANRTWMTVELLGLHDVIELVFAEMIPNERGWILEAEPEGRTAIHEVYRDGADRFTGRATVPILFDTKTGTIVNNESADIVRMLPQGFSAFHASPLDLCPEDLRSDIDAVNERVYADINNGVYRAGFAQTQASHDQAVEEVFEALDWLDDLLSDGRAFVVGDELTEADVRLVPTLLRFKAYREVFYCDLEDASSHPHVWAYRDRMRTHPAVASVTLPEDAYVHGYASIPFAAANNPSIEKRTFRAAS